MAWGIWGQGSTTIGSVIASLAAYALGAPIVHAAHGHWGKAGGDLGGLVQPTSGQGLRVGFGASAGKVLPESPSPRFDDILDRVRRDEPHGISEAHESAFV
jgi:hypothetical protein